MQAYNGYEVAQDLADNAAGQPAPSGTVNALDGGKYQVCFDNNCSTFSGCRTDAAGRITDLSANGQPVSERVAVGADATGSRLALSHVFALRPANYNNLAIVAFKVTGVRPLEGGDFLAQFDTVNGQLQEDDSQSELPTTIKPGESAYAVAVFDTHAITGKLILRLNDGPEAM